MSHKWSLSPELYVRAEQDTDLRLMDRIAQEARSPVPTDPSRPRMALVVGPSPFTMMRGWEYYLCTPFEGAALISTVVHNSGYPVRLIDVRYSLDPLQDAFRQVMEGCDVLGIATYEDCYPFLEDLIAMVKEARPDLPVILGGSLVTSVPHVFMQETKTDVAVISEGELTILELMDALADGTWERRLPEIRGIWYRDARGQVHTNPPRGQTPHLDFLPTMNLGLWTPLSPLGLQPQIITCHSRGCKMDCSFCYRTTPQLREKSPEKLRQELASYKKQCNLEFVFFADLTFTSDKRRTLEICEVIQEFGIRWTCMTRSADVDAEILAAMKRAGCHVILYGVESLSADILKTARKGTNENLTLRAMRLTQEAGIEFGGLMIVGLPGETEETLDHACRWAEGHRSLTRVKYLSAMPGTTVYRQGLESGLLKSEVDHLRWLSVEQALVHDEFVNFSGLPERVCREAYKRLVDCYLPGPVMNFKHWPEHGEKYYPDPDPSRSWRKEFSFWSAPTYPGVEKYRRPDLTPSAAMLADLGVGSPLPV